MDSWDIFFFDTDGSHERGLLLILQMEDIYFVVFAVD
jgi:hypothetical protein